MTSARNLLSLLMALVAVMPALAQSDSDSTGDSIKNKELEWSEKLKYVVNLAVTDPKETQSDSTKGHEAFMMYDYALLVSINNNNMYDGSAYASIAWKEKRSWNTCVRYGLALGGNISMNSSKGETDYVDTARSDIHGIETTSDSYGFPISISRMVQRYFKSSTPVRFYQIIGGSVELELSNYERSGNGSHTVGRSNSVGISPAAGLGFEWNCSERISLYIENQAYLRIGFSESKTETHFSSSSERTTIDNSKTSKVTFGLGYTKLGAAYYF